MGKGKGKFDLSVYDGEPTRSLSDNLSALLKQFPLSPSGYFGKRGSSNPIRRIRSANPEQTAYHFFKVIANGAGEKRDIPTGIVVALKDGTRITYRVTSSSDGSPAVDIKILASIGNIKRKQKIHFEKEL